MQAGKEESTLTINLKSLLALLLALIITFLLLFKNLIFQPTLILKSFGELSIEPQIAFNNGKPTFLEFYAEWCEVCKEMAPKVSDLRDEYKKNMNFVFLNVDNPKWENYLKEYEVNGIPQINLFDEKAKLSTTLIGKHTEEDLVESIKKLKGEIKSNEEIFNSNFSSIKDNKNYKINPRSHG